MGKFKFIQVLGLSACVVLTSSCLSDVDSIEPVKPDSLGVNLVPDAPVVDLMEGKEATFRFSLFKPKGVEVSVRKSGEFPAGARFNPNNLSVTWKPTRDQGNSKIAGQPFKIYHLAIQAVGNQGGTIVTTTGKVTVRVHDTNLRPTLMNDEFARHSGDRFYAQKELKMSFEIYDEDWFPGSPDGFSAFVSGIKTNVRGWPTLTTTNPVPYKKGGKVKATLTWTPTESMAGQTYLITYGSIDRIYNEERRVSETMNLEVRHWNRQPVVGTVPTQSLDQGSAFRAFLSAVDPDGDSVEWSLVYPQGNDDIELDSKTGELVWEIPETQKVGNYRITVRATDKNSRGADPLSADLTFYVRVTPAPAPIAPPTPPTPAPADPAPVPPVLAGAALFNNAVLVSEEPQATAWVREVAGRVVSLSSDSIHKPLGTQKVDLVVVDAQADVSLFERALPLLKKAKAQGASLLLLGQAVAQMDWTQKGYREIMEGSAIHLSSAEGLRDQVNLLSWAHGKTHSQVWVQDHSSAMGTVMDSKEGGRVVALAVDKVEFEKYKEIIRGLLKN